MLIVEGDDTRHRARLAAWRDELAAPLGERTPDGLPRLLRTA